MDSPVFLTLGSVFLVSLVSLVGIVLVPGAGPRREWIAVLMSLAVGAMLGSAFLHLIPESFSRAEDPYVPALLIITGLVVFSLLETGVKRHLATRSDPHRSIGYMNLIADGMHNFVDGVAVAAAYLVSPETGVATTFAVLMHEVPQELGDFGVLLHSGFSWRSALGWNLACAALSVAGATGVLLFGGSGVDLQTPLLPLVAGGFLYVALVDLLPELRHDLTPRLALIEVGAIALGVAIPYLLAP